MRTSIITFFLFKALFASAEPELKYEMREAVPFVNNLLYYFKAKGVLTRDETNRIKAIEQELNNISEFTFQDNSSLGHVIQAVDMTLDLVDSTPKTRRRTVIFVAQHHFPKSGKDLCVHYFLGVGLCYRGYYRDAVFYLLTSLVDPDTYDGYDENQHRRLIFEIFERENISLGSLCLQPQMHELQYLPTDTVNLDGVGQRFFSYVSDHSAQDFQFMAPKFVSASQKSYNKILKKLASSGFENEKISQLETHARLLHIGILNMCDPNTCAVWLLSNTDDPDSVCFHPEALGVMKAIKETSDPALALGLTNLGLLYRAYYALFNIVVELGHPYRENTFLSRYLPQQE